MERDKAFSLQDYLAVLRRQRWLVLGTALLVTIAGVAYFFLQTPMYAARSELQLERVRTAQDISVNELLNPTGTITDAEVAAATSAPVAEKAAAILGIDEPAPLRSQVTASVLEGTQRMRFTAIDTAPQRAAAIADAFATGYVEYRRDEAVETVRSARDELEQRASELREEIKTVDAQLREFGVPDPVEPDPDDPDATESPEQPNLTDDEESEFQTLSIRRQALQSQLTQVISRSTELGESAEALTGFSAGFTPAEVPTQPEGSDPLTAGGVSLIFGIALGVALAFLRDHFDDLIRDEDGFKRATGGVPIVGRIPSWKPEGGTTERLASLVEPTSGAAEAYRELSAGVRFMLVARAEGEELSRPDAELHHGLGRSRSVMVASANMGEGKTSTAANLAVATARVGLRTVLVDADLRRSSVAKRFGLDRTLGLSDVLLNGEAPEAYLLDVGVGNLRVLPAGTVPPNPTELLASPAMRALQQRLLHLADLVIYDTPAVLAVPDALEIGPYVDLAFIVGRVGQTGRRRISAAMERLEQVGTDVSGTVLNGLDPNADGYYYAYYYRDEDTRGSKRRGGRKRDAAASPDPVPASRGRG